MGFIDCWWLDCHGGNMLTTLTAHSLLFHGVPKLAKRYNPRSASGPDREPSQLAPCGGMTVRV